MKLDPIAIINASNNWSEFEGFLLELGDAPNFKKLSELLSQLAVYFRNKFL